MLIALLFLLHTTLHKLERERLVTVPQPVQGADKRVETIRQAVQEGHRHVLIINRHRHGLERARQLPDAVGELQDFSLSDTVAV